MIHRSTAPFPSTSYSVASVNSLRGRLYLLAKCPRRDGRPGLTPTRIALRLDDTPVNRKAAAKQLQTLERQLKEGGFDWNYWLDAETSGVTWREAVTRLYRAKVVLGRTGETTWQINYMGRLRQIPPGSACTTESMAQALARYPRESCSYKELFYLMRHIARLVGQPFPEVPLPTYHQAQAVEVPTDAEIEAWVLGAGPSAWYFGIMATYGLRPHEIEGATLVERDYLQVAEKTKTGGRIVVPLLRDWVELFDLRNRRNRPIHDTTRPDAVSKYLSSEIRRLGLPWRPYALRHAYAARLWRQGGAKLDIYTAARLMGHSVMQHSRTYRRHISPHHVAEAAERALDLG